MSESKHTPGPWEVHHGTDVTGYPCYFIHGFGGDEKHDTAMHEANARLIASAPDLLAEVERLRASNAELLAALKECLAFATRNELGNFAKRCRAAIARAEGGEG